jgi:acyl carrier protein
MDPIADTIAGIVAEVAEVNRDDIVASGTLADVGVDSLMGIEIAVHVEQTFGVYFNEDELGEIRTFSDLVTLTRAKLGPSA